MSERAEERDFAGVLGSLVQRSGYNVCQLARLTLLPRMTLVNWLEGQVKKPRVWQDMVKVCRALRLTSDETNQLLRAAGHPALEQLRQQAQDEPDQMLLSFWLTAVSSISSPFQAIPDLPTFVGRESLLTTLQELLLAPHHAAPYVLEGMAGVGKTALAARLAYHLHPRPSDALRTSLPDGVLWLHSDLTDPMTALKVVAAAYGQDVAGYPDMGSLSQMVRGLLAYKQALLVLDNVVNESDVAALLPPSGSCAVLITTRRRNLTLGTAATRFVLHGFEAEQDATLALFSQILGAARVAEEQDALLELAAWVGHLPLALDIIACRLAYEPGWTAAEFWARLCRAQNSLASLTFAERNLTAVLTTSYEALSPQQQQLFMALAAFAGYDFTVSAAATAADVSLEAADTFLKELFCLSFVRRGQEGRYRLPPVLQALAEQKAMGH